MSPVSCYCNGLFNLSNNVYRHSNGCNCFFLTYKGFFHYVASFNNGLTENEVDHVFVGYGDPPELLADTNEIVDSRWVGVDALKKALAETPEFYTPWLEQALKVALSTEYAQN